MLKIVLISLFIISYSFIALEQIVKINKSAVAIFSGVLSWIFVMTFSSDPINLNTQLGFHISEIASVLFFLMGAMTIVELIDAHNGFDVITQKLIDVKPMYLILIIGFMTFFLSAVLDNLTSTILIVSVIRKLLPEGKLRLYFVGLIIISANAGGAWSPIGDVTTTMLWIGGQTSSNLLISSLFLPSLINLIVPLFIIYFIIHKQKLFSNILINKVIISSSNRSGALFILIAGLFILLAVPLFKFIFNLPPFMGMLFGLGLLWCITEIKNRRRDDVDKNNHSVAFALRNIDTPSILFFLGILLSISSLETCGLLSSIALNINASISNQNLVLLFTGLISAIIDNVPLVAAYQGMYSLKDHASDSSFWHLLAYCSGTGGSILIIGSAAGVVAMGIEKISFRWYLKYISFLAILGYLSGFLTYLILN